MRGFEVDRRDFLRFFEQVVAAFEVRVMSVGAQDLGTGHRGVVGDECEVAVGDSVVADILVRIASKLRRMNARIRTEADLVSVLLDVGFLVNRLFMLNLVTDFGIVDVTLNPSGPLEGFSKGNADASSQEVADGLVIRVASLADLIESSRAPDRDKDRQARPPHGGKALRSDGL